MDTFPSHDSANKKPGEDLGKPSCPFDGTGQLSMAIPEHGYCLGIGRSAQLRLVSPQQQPIHPSALRELLVPLIVEMHTKNVAQDLIQRSPFLHSKPHRPLALRVIWHKRIRKPVVEPARASVTETEWQDLEGRYGSSDETPPQFEI